MSLHNNHPSDHGDSEDSKVLVRRSRAELVYTLLDTARRGATRSKLVKASGLPQKSADKHITLMLKRGLLLERQGLYFVSEKGRSFMSEFDKYKQLRHEYLEKLKAVREMIPRLYQIQGRSKN
ncbi:MAG: winged helix-turn-helix domain-containing protein [Conexivisphaerales archaeon]